MRFADRRDAGRALAGSLDEFRPDHPIVLGLPRGGVVVAWEVARHLDAPLDVIVVRKLGVPWQPELAMGAIGEDGVRVLEPRVVREAGVSEAHIMEVERKERQTLADRVEKYRGSTAPLPIHGRTVIIVDDGVATGSTARAACRVARAREAAQVVIAVPVAPSGVERKFAEVADRVVCLWSPADFYAVGQFYQDFGQTTDAEVTQIMAAAGR